MDFNIELRNISGNNFLKELNKNKIEEYYNKLKCSLVLNKTIQLSQFITTKKYFEKFNFYFAKPINEIHANVRTSHVILFQDYLFWDDFTEYLKRYYQLNEVSPRVLALTEFYSTLYKQPLPYLGTIEQSKIMIKRQSQLNQVFNAQQKNNQTPEINKKNKIQQDQELHQSSQYDKILQSNQKSDININNNQTHDNQSQIQSQKEISSSHYDDQVQTIISYEKKVYNIYNPSYSSTQINLNEEEEQQEFDNKIQEDFLILESKPKNESGATSLQFIETQELINYQNTKKQMQLSQEFEVLQQSNESIDLQNLIQQELCNIFNQKDVIMLQNDLANQNVLDPIKLTDIHLNQLNKKKYYLSGHETNKFGFKSPLSNNHNNSSNKRLLITSNTNPLTITKLSQGNLTNLNNSKQAQITSGVKILTKKTENLQKINSSNNTNNTQNKIDSKSLGEQYQQQISQKGKFQQQFNKFYQNFGKMDNVKDLIKKYHLIQNQLGSSNKKSKTRVSTFDYMTQTINFEDLQCYEDTKEIQKQATGSKQQINSSLHKYAKSIQSFKKSPKKQFENSNNKRESTMNSSDKVKNMKKLKRYGRSQAEQEFRYSSVIKNEQISNYSSKFGDQKNKSVSQLRQNNPIQEIKIVSSNRNNNSSNLINIQIDTNLNSVDNYNIRSQNQDSPQEKEKPRILQFKQYKDQKPETNKHKTSVFFGCSNLNNEKFTAKITFKNHNDEKQKEKIQFLAKTYGSNNNNTQKLDININLQQSKKRSQQFHQNFQNIRMDTNPLTEDTQESSQGPWTSRSVKFAGADPLSFQKLAKVYTDRNMPNQQIIKKSFVNKLTKNKDTKSNESTSPDRKIILNKDVIRSETEVDESPININIIKKGLKVLKFQN